MNILRYVRYSRKSSEAKEKQALSIKDQNAECDLVIVRDDLDVVARLEESKTSFKPNKRPEFNKMIKMIEEGKANAILTWKPDRLCRNPREGGIVLQLLQDGILKEIRTAMGDIYNPESDHLILQIHFDMANQYSRNLSQNVKRGLKRKVQDRKEYPRRAILGYQGKGIRGQRNIEPHPIESGFIVDAFHLASTGTYSLNNISELLYEKGFRTKNGKKIGKSHLQKILTNDTYYGYFYYNKELCEGNYKPLITKGLFDLVQERLMDRTRPKKIEWDREFLGLIKCSNCGCSVTTTFKKKYVKKEAEEKTFVYHHCTHRRGHCKEQPITDKILKDMLYEEIGRIIIDQEVWRLGIELIKAKHADEISKSKSQLKQIYIQKDAMRDKINRLVEMRAAEELTKDEFVENKERLVQEMARLDSIANDNSHSVKTWLELMEDFFDTAFNALDVVKGDDFEEKQRILKKIGENYILEDRKLVFNFQKPFDILLQPAYRTNVLPDVDSNHEP